MGQTSNFNQIMPSPKQPACRYKLENPEIRFIPGTLDTIFEPVELSAKLKGKYPKQKNILNRKKLSFSQLSRGHLIISRKEKDFLATDNYR